MKAIDAGYNNNNNSSKQQFNVRIKDGRMIKGSRDYIVKGRVTKMKPAGIFQKVMKAGRR